MNSPAQATKWFLAVDWFDGVLQFEAAVSVMDWQQLLEKGTRDYGSIATSSSPAPGPVEPEQSWSTIAPRSPDDTVERTSSGFRCRECSRSFVFWHNCRKHARIHEPCKLWICVDRTDYTEESMRPKRPLANCKCCQANEGYLSDRHCEDHLRRVHFVSNLPASDRWETGWIERKRGDSWTVAAGQPASG